MANVKAADRMIGSSYKNWILAIRPKTLPAVVAPITIAAILARESASFNLIIFLSVLAFGINIQILTNLVNDLFDFLKGADGKDRTGPRRVIESGLISITQIKLAIGLVTLASLILAFYLTIVAGYSILFLALLSILLAYAYTSGPYPLSYLGLGDIFVFIFFGPVACSASYFIFTQTITPLPIILGTALGLISTGILVVNNIRDFEGDRKANKNTLVVKFGVRFGRIEYLVLMVSAALIPIILAGTQTKLYWVLLSSGFIIPAIPTIKTVLTSNNALKLNNALEKTGRLLLYFCLLFFIGYLFDEYLYFNATQADSIIKFIGP